MRVQKTARHSTRSRANEVTAIGLARRTEHKFSRYEDACAASQPDGPSVLATAQSPRLLGCGCRGWLGLGQNQ